MSQRATNKKIDLDGCPGLTPVILATWEVDIGNILILGQPRQKSPQWKKILCIVVSDCHPSHCKKVKIGGFGTLQPGQKARAYIQNNWITKVRDIAQTLEYLSQSTKPWVQTSVKKKNSRCLFYVEYTLTYKFF
jgi:hypothetical protein